MMNIPPAIDHPSQQMWALSGMDIPNIEQSKAIRERFAHTSEDVDAILDAVNLTSMRTDIYRQNYESATIHNGLDLSCSEIDRYHSYAGKPERIADFIRWFSLVGNVHYTSYPVRKDDKKVGLEIGGRRQGGDWEATRELDDMVRSIPAMIEDDPNMSIKVLDKPRQRAVAYRFTPLDSIRGTKGEFKFGVVRRRRAVANIITTLPILTEVTLFKESHALIIPSQLSLDERRKIFQDVADNPRQNLFLNQLTDEELEKNPIYPANNTVAASIAGRVFERGIRAEEGTTTDVLPTSAHYVMTMKAPTFRP